MKAIDWTAVRAATPGTVTCPHCGRERIVVNKTTGLRAPHYREPKTSSSCKSKRARTPCEGGDRLHTSQPDTSTRGDLNGQ